MNVRAQLWRRIIQSHAEYFCWVCPSCETINPFRETELWVGRAKVLTLIPEEELENLPVMASVGIERCAVCGSRGTELHHWAPQGIFGPEDANKWPMDYLCKVCHDHWHRMVTPTLKK